MAFGVVKTVMAKRALASRATLSDVATYRDQVEAEFAALAREFLDATEERYGTLPHVDVFGIVIGVSYTPDDAEPDEDQAFSHDAVGFRFSDQKPWVQVGLLRKALLAAEGDDE